MTGRRIVIFVEDSTPVTLSVQRGFGDSLYATMTEAGVTLAEMHDDGFSDCFDVLAYDNMQQFQDACRAWQNRPMTETMLDSVFS